MRLQVGGWCCGFWKRITQWPNKETDCRWARNGAIGTTGGRDCVEGSKACWNSENKREEHGSKMDNKD